MIESIKIHSDNGGMSKSPKVIIDNFDIGNQIHSQMPPQSISFHMNN